MSQSRIERFAEQLRNSGADAFFAHSPVTMGYLHGIHEHAGERFLTLAIRPTGEVAMIAPALSETQARRCGVQDVRTWKDGEDPLELLKALSNEWNLRSGILAVDDEMPARMLLQMQDALPAALFKAGGALVAALTSRKEPAEVETMRRAGQIADEAFLEVFPRIKAGMTELQVDKLLRDAMAARGGEPAFCIVGAGPNGAEPHHLSDASILKEGDVLILDFGCDLEGYKSDITRTVSVGEASDEAKKVYEIVYAAHMAARRTAGLSATGEQVDSAARNVIKDAGYGEYFFHRTGHGIGQQVHEEPNMVAGNTKPLEMGNAFSVEPGIYLPGKFGVRIENIVAITEKGAESMNAEPSPTLVATTS